MAIVLQNAGKQGFFVISVRNSREIDEKFDYFMQNKANFRKAQMNVNSFITKDYRKNDAFAVQKNKPNSNPNKANLKRAKMNLNIYYTEVYENILCIRSQ